MLGNRNAAATIAVKDLEAARRFYEEKLGLEPTGASDAEVAVYRSGTSEVIVYRSAFAGTNKATSATWGVGADLDAIVEGLKGAGVTFERYDMPGAKHDGDVHVFGTFRAAWFRDPEGNILHINNG